MSQPTLCAAPIQGTRMRLIRLDECGIPVTGAGSLVVTKGFVNVAVTQQYQDGTEYVLRNAQGEYCVDEIGPDQFRRVDLNMQFCRVDPDIVNLITGSMIVTTGAPVTGTGFWVTEGSVEQRFSLEVWQAVAGAECVDGEQQHVYWAFPNVRSGRFNDFTIEDGVLTWQLSGRSDAAAPEWGSGPSSVDWITSVPTGAHYGFNIAALPLPAETGCGSVALT